MGWDDLVTEFRALGGIFDNVELRRGPRGRGLFPIDSTRPVTMKVPPNLLIPSKDIEIRAGQLVCKRSATLGERERTFFEHYQRQLGWGAGLLDELTQEQREWSRLPPDVQHVLREASIVSALQFLFLEPDDDSCLQRYLSTRQSNYHGSEVLMPFVELVNCSSSTAVGFQHANGITVSGTFADEILVDYNSTADCWDRAVKYGHFDSTIHACSMALRYQSAGAENIQIYKRYQQAEHRDKMALPLVQRAQDSTIEFSYLMLGNSCHPRLPRGIFQHLSKGLALQGPDETFEIVQHYNRVQLLRFLDAAESVQTPLASTLRRAARQQLLTLSYCWGTVA